MTEEKKMMHVGIRKGDIGGYVLLPGSPERSAYIATLLEDAEEVAYNREYRTFTGHLSGERVSVTSTGMGGPSVAIAVEELRECGAHTLLRVGTCVSASEKVQAGDFILPNGAVRMEGVGRHYLPEEYPAVPDMGMLACAREALEAGKTPFHIGVAITTARYLFHPGAAGGVSEEVERKWKSYLAGGALCSEMNCAPLFLAAGSLGMRAAALLICAYGKDSRSDDLASWPQEYEKRVSQASVEALARLIGRDRI